MKTLAYIYLGTLVFYIIAGYFIMFKGYLDNASYLASSERGWKIRNLVAAFMFCYTIVVVVGAVLLLIFSIKSTFI